MLEKLTFDEFIKLSKSAKRVSVFQEIKADQLTIPHILKALSKEMQDGVVFESGLQNKNGNSQSFLAFDLMAQLSVKKNEVNPNPFSQLRKFISKLAFASKKDISDTANIIGFVSYDAVRFFETIPDKHATEQEAFPDIQFNCYRTTLTLNYQHQILLINTIVEIESDLQSTYYKAEEKIFNIIEKITAFPQPLDTQIGTKKKPSTPADVDINDSKFSELVSRAKKYIKKGDAFQIVLSRCFKKLYTVSAFDIYCEMRKMSPSPYLFYIPIDDHTVIIGASPERMISVQQRKVTINPIAGTYPSAKDKNKIKNELLNDQKELAEHMMLVDLARNDLGKVCKPGSIKIDELLQVKHFSHVSHLTSVITGDLRKNYDALDALAATFPAGTLSGAPKIRAMQIIDELETSRRGLYGGAICRIDHEGNLDSCIAIRMALLKNGTATVRAGAGIVFDSNPLKETQETRYKANTILEAIAQAEGEVI